MWCNGRWGRRWRRRWGVQWVVASLVMPMAMGVVGVVTGDGDVSGVHGRGVVVVDTTGSGAAGGSGDGEGGCGGFFDVCGRLVAGVVGPVWAGWWWWLWLDCSVVVVLVGGLDDGPWVCGGGWACMVVVMVCHCGWCWVW